ncbi:hypothetical protein CHARACLAT_020361 [Characodon lateralis]|uniref:Uncharacterized protein n=1 Tax=Characodon lateralis TaxID=208331 RepID=A0ABU7DCS4_9TELE|nr:hypothetical protein [Characodon lateralis]
MYHCDCEQLDCKTITQHPRLTTFFCAGVSSFLYFSCESAVCLHLLKTLHKLMISCSFVFFPITFSVTPHLHVSSTGTQFIYWKVVASDRNIFRTQRLSP